MTYFLGHMHFQDRAEKNLVRHSGRCSLGSVRVFTQDAKLYSHNCNITVLSCIILSLISNLNSTMLPELYPFFTDRLYQHFLVKVSYIADLQSRVKRELLEQGIKLE